MRDVKYIVRGSQIAKAVHGALLKTIANKDIVNIINRAVMNGIQTVLEDDCEELVAYLDDLPTVYEQLPSVDIVRCKDCKHNYLDGIQVRFNRCELNHNKVHSDDWFCADAERREDG